MAKKFGSYAVLDPITYHFEKEPAWWWKIVPPSSGKELSMQKFMVNSRTERGIDGVLREFPPTTIEVAHREIALLFGGTNIPKEDVEVADGGEPILKDNAKVEEIEVILRLMPNDMVMEIWSAIGDTVPGWGMARPKEEKSSQS